MALLTCYFVRLGWTYWGAGPRFGSAFLTVEPTGYPPKPSSKLTAIKPHMKNPIVALTYPTIRRFFQQTFTALTFYCSRMQRRRSHYLRRSIAKWLARLVRLKQKLTLPINFELNNHSSYRSWATHSLTSTNSMSGNAVSFVPSNNAAFWVSRPSGQNFSIASYNAIQFGIAGDAPGNQAIDVSFWITGGTPSGASTPPIDYVVNRTISSTYRVATIPFAVLDIPADKRITGISWQDVRLCNIVRFAPTLPRY